jgi:hypothetical protein
LGDEIQIGVIHDDLIITLLQVGYAVDPVIFANAVEEANAAMYFA